MNRGVYTVARGMIAAQQALDTVANNLANVNSVGYKADGLMFADALDRELTANGGLGLQVGRLGSGAEAKGGYTDFAQGSIHQTSNPLDVALEDGGKAMFAVKTPAGVRYTRDGSFSRNADGGLVTKDGYPVLDAGGNPIQLPVGTVEIHQDGKMTGANGAWNAQLGMFQGTFRKQGGNLYETVGNANATPTTAQVQQGALEESNVNPVTSMIRMIELQRAFEMAQKAAQGQDEATQKLNGTMGNGG